MDPIVQAAIVTAIAAVVGAGFGFRSTRIVERSKNEAVKSTNLMEGVSLQIDSWKELNTAKDTEIVRLRDVIKGQRTEIRNLNAELAAQRRETRSPDMRTRHDD